jgi:hypothetical protein
MRKNKVQKNKLKAYRSEKGVTLLLTLMILAAISAIVFSISVIALNEVKTSSDEINSEPAITGAEAMAEQMLYDNIRGLNSSCTGTPLNETLPSSGVATTFVNSYYYPGTYITSVAANSSQVLYLYDPCLPGAAANYTSLSVQMGATGNGNVAVCSWNLSNCQASPDIAGYSLSAGQDTTNVTGGPTPLNSNAQYQIILTNTTGSPESFGLTTTSTSPSVITGIPAPIVTIITTGSLGGVTRKLQTLLPPSY